MLKYKHIAIEGNIGAGKTTLAKMLSSHLDSSLLLEEFEDNHFLKAFYNGKDFAIHAEIQFILDRSKQLADFFSKKHQLIISDYVPEKSLIFSKLSKFFFHDDQRDSCQSCNNNLQKVTSTMHY